MLPAVGQELLPPGAPGKVPGPGLVDVFPDDFVAGILAKAPQDLQLGFRVLVFIIGGHPGIQSHSHFRPRFLQTIR